MSLCVIKFCKQNLQISLHVIRFCKQNQKIWLFISFFLEMMWYFLLIVIVLIIAFWGLKCFQKWRILDKPGSDLKNTRAPVPTLQGVFVILAMMVVVGVFFPQWYSSQLFLGLLIPSLLIGTVELIEELSYLGKFPKIPPFIRLVVHLLSAGLAIWIWWLGNQELIFGGIVYHIPHRIFSIAFLIWTMFCINAINRFDGIYAQGSGVSAIGFFTLFALIKWVVFSSYDSFPNLEILLFVQNMAFILFVISLVYAVIEYKPLGLVRDVGIMVFGFAIAYLSILWGVKIGTILVALSLPLFDAIWVGLYRIFVMKKNPLNGDYTHFHHRLMGLGFSRGETRVFIRIWSMIMMILMIMQWADRFNKIVIFILMASLFFWINWYLFIYKKLPCGLQIQKER